MVKQADPDKIKIDSIFGLEKEFDLLQTAFNLAETEHTWEIIDKALKRFHAVVRGGVCKSPFAQDFIKGLKIKVFVVGFVRSMATERTRLSGTTLDLLSSLTRLSTSFSALLSSYLPPLLRLLCRTNKLYISRTLSTLGSIIKNTKLPNVLDYIVAEWKLEGGKSSSYRIGASELVLTLLGGAGGEGAEVIIDKSTVGDKWLDELEWCVRAGATDKEVKVRATTKMIWDIYSREWPERVTSFTAPLTPVIRKYLHITAAPLGASTSTSLSTSTNRAPIKRPKVPSPLRPTHSSTVEPKKSNPLSRSLGPTSAHPAKSQPSASTSSSSYLSKSTSSVSHHARPAKPLPPLYNLATSSFVRSAPALSSLPPLPPSPPSAPTVPPPKTVSNTASARFKPSAPPTFSSTSTLGSSSTGPPTLTASRVLPNSRGLSASLSTSTSTGEMGNVVRKASRGVFPSSSSSTTISTSTSASNLASSSSSSLLSSASINGAVGGARSAKVTGGLFRPARAVAAIVPVVASRRNREESGDRRKVVANVSAVAVPSARAVVKKVEQMKPIPVVVESVREETPVSEVVSIEARVTLARQEEIIPEERAVGDVSEEWEEGIALIDVAISSPLPASPAPLLRSLSHISSLISAQEVVILAEQEEEIEQNVIQIDQLELEKVEDSSATSRSTVAVGQVVLDQENMDVDLATPVVESENGVTVDLQVMIDETASSEVQHGVIVVDIAQVVVEVPTVEEEIELDQEVKVVEEVEEEATLSPSPFSIPASDSVLLIDDLAPISSDGIIEVELEEEVGESSIVESDPEESIIAPTASVAEAVDGNHLSASSEGTGTIVEDEEFIESEETFTADSSLRFDLDQRESYHTCSIIIDSLADYVDEDDIDEGWRSIGLGGLVRLPFSSSTPSTAAPTIVLLPHRSPDSTLLAPSTPLVPLQDAGAQTERNIDSVFFDDDSEDASLDQDEESVGDETVDSDDVDVTLEADAETGGDDDERIEESMADLHSFIVPLNDTHCFDTFEDRGARDFVEESMLLDVNLDQNYHVVDDSLLFDQNLSSSPITMEGIEVIEELDYEEEEEEEDEGEDEAQAQTVIMSSYQSHFPPVSRSPEILEGRHRHDQSDSKQVEVRAVKVEPEDEEVPVLRRSLRSRGPTTAADALSEGEKGLKKKSTRNRDVLSVVQV